MHELKKSKLYIVDADILPEAILKTAQIKELLTKNGKLTINEAAEQVGLSRSAFYKYRDGVFPFYQATRERIVTLLISLAHEAGVLSQCLNVIASSGGNVLTINQGIPLQGVATATIAFDTKGIENDLEDILEKLYDISGVIQVEILGQS